LPDNVGVSFSIVFLDKNYPVDPRVDEMIRWGNRFREMGIVHGEEGNLSVRTKLGFIISGDGVMLESMTKDSVVEIRGVVFGLNRPSVYTKGLLNPSMLTLLHSAIYENFPEVNAILHTHDNDVLKAAEKLGVPSTDIEQPADSRELAQEAVNVLQLNKGVRYFVLKNHGIIALGTTMSEAGALMEEMHTKATGGAKAKTAKKK
jgi:ribulose-5-phosphate 4-epimerase/fuculose-1-phosphate aldolase